MNSTTNLNSSTCNLFSCNYHDLLICCHISCHRDHVGESILHLWIEKLREHLQMIEPSAEPVNATEVTATIVEEDFPKKFSTLDLENSKEVCPPILSADPFTERKSTFQGHAAVVTNVHQVK